MLSEHETLAKEVFCDVAEKTAFMLADPLEKDDLEEAGGPCVQVVMHFTGGMKGSVSIAAPEGMKSELAANILGMDADNPTVAAQADDALKELLNVTCGNLLTAIAGEGTVFDLSLPEIADLEEDTWQSLVADDETIAFDVDDHLVLLRFEVEE